MSVITLDAETFYRSKKNRTTPGPRYSLSGSTGKTYEMYIRDPSIRSIKRTIAKVYIH
jgi:hypothetical protein